MKRCVLCLAVLALFAGSLLRTDGAAPADVSKVLSVEDLAAEAKDTARKLANAVASQESFDRAIEQKTITRGGGLIACLAQAIAEHKEGKETGIAAAALRDAALGLRGTKKLDDAKSALEKVNAALEGEGDKAETEFAWNKLINMHRMMEEIEVRQGSLRRTLSRPRRLPRSSGNATVIAVLSLAMEADTHEVKNKDDLPKWADWSKKYREAMSQLAAAMKADEAEKAQGIFKASVEHCDACHEKFRD